MLVIFEGSCIKERAGGRLLREILSRFHSPDVVEQIIKSSAPGEGPRPFLDGKTATISFCDIQGFTALTERLPVEEIAGIMKCSVGTVKSRLSRARDALRRKLAGYVEG